MDDIAKHLWDNEYAVIQQGLELLGVFLLGCAKVWDWIDKRKKKKKP